LQYNDHINFLALKKIIFILFLTISTITASAQGSYNFREWGIGIEGGGVKPFVDLKNTDFGYSGAASLIYNYSPYVPVALEFQMGRLSGGGNSVEEDQHTRKFVNNYKAVFLHFDVQLGEFLDYSNSTVNNLLKGFYVGSGGGFVFNNNKVNRYSLTNIGYMFPGKDKSTNGAIPLRFGYEFKIYDGYDEPSLRIDIGYRHYLVFGEGLDGYADPSAKFKNNAVDQFAQLTLGIKYSFGNTVYYSKSIRP
jgi:hypothetical protein